MQAPEYEYALIFQGQVAEGCDVAEVRERCTALMGCDPQKTAQLFSGRRLVFKRCASEDEANQAADRFRHIGMVVEIYPVARKSAPQSAPPSAPLPDPASPETPSAPAMPPASDPAEDAAAPTAPPAPVVPRRWAATQPGMKKRRVPFVFNGDGSEFFKIWIVNVLLTILTLGIYSAWAKVRTLRYFYGNTSLDGSAFEYLADPIKILKGRLLVFGYFVVVAITVYFYPLLKPLFGLLLFAMTPWIVRQTLRFRCRYMAWRGVRFAFVGSLWDAAKAFFLWPLLPFAGIAAFSFLYGLMGQSMLPLILVLFFFCCSPFLSLGIARPIISSIILVLALPASKITVQQVTSSNYFSSSPCPW